MTSSPSISRRLWGGQDARADVDSQVPEGCASTSGRGGDAVGVHERISRASVETRRPDRLADPPRSQCRRTSPSGAEERGREGWLTTR